MIDSTHPESYSTLASIRISQQRQGDARIAVQQAWELFKSSAESQRLNQSLSVDGSDEVSQITALKNLTRLSIETELYDIAEDVCKRILSLDEDIAEVWYLSGLASAQKYSTSGDASTLLSAYESFQTALELTESNADEAEELTEELQQKIAETEAELSAKGVKYANGKAGGPRNGDDDDDDEWLDEIEDDE